MRYEINQIYLVMPLIFNHFWIMFIVITTANGLVWKSRSKKYIAQNPSLKEGYDSFVASLIGWAIGIVMMWNMNNPPS